MSYMHSFEYILVLLAAVLASSIIDQFLPRISTPLIQTALGVALVIVPVIPFAEDGLDPNLFLILFIAPLLFDDAKRINKQTLFSLYRPILSLAIGLVVATCMVLGFVCHWLVPSIPLAACFALAAALAPTDVIAVFSLEENTEFHRNQAEILKGEGLLNDAASIVSFQFAVAAVMTASFSVWDASLSLVLMFAGGLAVGVVLMLLRFFVMRLFTNSGLESSTFFVLFEVITPCLVYLVAELLSVSGIVAVVAAGIAYSYSPRGISPVSARQTIVSSSVWSVIVFTLSGLCFIMLGAQIPHVFLGIVVRTDIDMLQLVICVFCLLVSILVLRFVWILVLGRHADLTEADFAEQSSSAAQSTRVGLPPLPQLHVRPEPPVRPELSEHPHAGRHSRARTRFGRFFRSFIPDADAADSAGTDRPDRLDDDQPDADDWQMAAIEPRFNSFFTATGPSDFRSEVDWRPRSYEAILIEERRTARNVQYIRQQRQKAEREQNRRRAHADPKYWQHHLTDALQLTVAGSKGSITLALVFGIPFLLTDGSAFPERDVIMFVAAGVILISLTLTSFSLPLLSPKKPRELLLDDEVEAMGGIYRQVIRSLLENTASEDQIIVNRVVSQYDERLQQLLSTRSFSDSEELQLRSQIALWEREHTLELITEGRVGTWLGMYYLNKISRQLARLEHHSSLTESLRALAYQFTRLFRRFKMVRGIRRENPTFDQTVSRLQLRGLQIENLNYVMECLEKLRAELDGEQNESTLSAQVVNRFVFVARQQLMRSSRRFRLRMQMLTSTSGLQAELERRELRLSARALQWEREAIGDALRQEKISRKTAKEMYDSVAAMELDIEEFID